MNQKGSSNRVCWVCGSSEHIKTDCDILKKDTKYPYDKWFINQAVNTQRKYNQYQEKQREDEKSHIDDDAMSAISAMSGNDKDVWGGSKKATKTGSSNLQLGVSMNNTKKENNDLKNKWWNDFILDSGTTFSMLANRRLADKVFQAREPIIMHTNAGHKTLNEEAEVPGFGDMYLNEEGLANIFGLDDLVKRGYRVKFDSDIENAFQVYGPDNKLKGKFDRTVEGLYAMKFGGGKPTIIATDNDDNKGGMACNNMITTEKQAKKLYTPEQRRRAERARRLFDAVGPMTTENFKAVLRTNIIQDNPVVHEDCDIADAILNPKSKSYIQGKWVRQQPKKVVHTEVAIPAELIVKYRDIVLCMDTMHVSPEAFLATVDKTVKYRGCESIKG